MAASSDSTTWPGVDPEPQRSDGRCLVAIAGPDRGLRVDLRGIDLCIGRDSSCEVRVSHRSVSRRHCLLHLGTGSATVRDLGSTNGTWVNGRRLSHLEEAPLALGEVLRVGDAVLKLLSEDDVEAEYHRSMQGTFGDDPGTDVGDRRYLEDQLEREMARCARHERSLAVMLVEVDDLKSVIERHGAGAGEGVLRRLARLLREVCRREDCLCRYDGDSFLVLMPETGLAGARAIGARVAGAVELDDLGLPGDEGSTLTVSVGIARWSPMMQAPSELLRAAEAKLAEAKETGPGSTAW